MSKKSFVCKKCKQQISSTLLESIHTKVCAACRDKALGYSTLATPTPHHAKRCKQCIELKQKKN